ncbi:hypothetical protein MMC34_001450 [Xylographa carneopallida]|nr:hypothetical protein [Xylographa carneopallida]
MKQNQQSTNLKKVYPRRIGNSPQDATSFHAGQALWSKQNLPDIFYMLHPTKEWRKHAFSRRPDVKRDQARMWCGNWNPTKGSDHDHCWTSKYYQIRSAQTKNMSSLSSGDALMVASGGM